MAPGGRVSHAAGVITWTSAVWATEEFRAELHAFVAAAVGVPDRIEPVSLRPWSAVWRVVVGGRTSYVKQNCPGQAQEARLLAWLGRCAPDHVVPLLAADPARDLLLTDDLGPTLSATGADRDADTWCGLVADAADLQRRVAPGVGTLGLTVLAPGDATTYVADAVGRLGALAPGDPRRLAPEAAARLEALLPDVDRWADRVEGLGLPTTLIHNDLHPGNVVASGSGLRFFDFADAVAGDPLGNLLVPLSTAAGALGVEPGDSVLRRIADAALEVWGDLAPLAELRAALPAALQLGRLARVESWRRCVATMTEAERADFGSAPADWLATLGDAPPVGAPAPLG